MRSAGTQEDSDCRFPAVVDGAYFAYPLEIIQHILIQCRIQDVIAFSSTCRLAHSMIFSGSNETLLWRDIFLANFDDPRRIPLSSTSSGRSIAWRFQAYERLRAEVAAQSPHPIFPTSRALQIFVSAIHEVPPLSWGKSTQSLNLQWLERILPTSDLLRIGTDGDIKHSKDMVSAQLRAYIGLSYDRGKDDKTRARLFQRRKNSRLYVYNVRNYSGRYWGPFLDDGRVDWIHIEHLVNVLVMNIRQLPDDWPRLSPPCGLNATREGSAPTNGLDEHRDWARVAGGDHNPLAHNCSLTSFKVPGGDVFHIWTSAFNFGFNEQIDPTFFDCPRFREATRFLELKLHLVDVERSRFRHHLWSTSSYASINMRYPPIYFAGTSCNYKGNEAVVEGVVHLTLDGTVRWQFSSTHPESARWCSDGAQIGNIASASGVVGVWTTEYRRKDDPVGPFWLWKVPDDYPVQLMEYSR